MNKKTKKISVIKESFEYVRECRKYIYFVALLFLLCAMVGFFYSSSFAFFDELLKELIDKTEGLGFLEMFWFIFSNNITSSFLGMILGILFGFFPIFTSAFNGTLLGYVYSRASSLAGLEVIWRLLPHGIFELPAIFISLGIGIKLGFFVFEKEKKKEFLRRFKKSLKTFAVVIIPLLVIAAIVEGYLIVYIG